MFKLNFKFMTMVAATIIANVLVAQGQVTILSQAVNPCGIDGNNEFIIARTGSTGVNIADLGFSSGAAGTVAGGGSGTANDNLNYTWLGSNLPTNGYSIVGLSNENPETVANGGGNEVYGFLYPSIFANNTIITSRITDLNTAAGCTVFLPVPSTNIIPAGSNIIVLLGAGNCTLDVPATNLNFGNHCASGTQYYVVLGTGDGGGGACSNTSSGYFGNSATRTSYSLLYNSALGANTAIGNYAVNTQTYTSTSVTTGSAGVATPGAGGTATYVTNQGCVPSPNIILPISLVWFDAKNGLGSIVLSWETASEENNSHFDVERSLDAINFEKIGTVKGNGTTNTKRSYTFTDANPYGGMNYYRLRQVDLDGKTTVSHMAFAKYTSKLVSFEQVYPNPFINELNLVISNAIATEATLSIVDVTGRIVSTQAISLQAGNNSLNLSTTQLAQGIYNLVLRTGKTVVSTRIVK